MSDTTMTVRLPSKAKRQLEKLAHATGRTRSFLAAEAIQAYLETESWQITAIQEGVKAADAGHFVEHEKVAAWLNSWGSDRETEPPKCD